MAELTFATVGKALVRELQSGSGSRRFPIACLCACDDRGWNPVG